jgi:predicted RNA methylase
MEYSARVHADADDAEKRKALSQWYTPPDMAERLWGWCHVLGRKHVPFRVLEPSAGDGALVRPMLASASKPEEVDMFEVDPARRDALFDLSCKLAEAGICSGVSMQDFLSCAFEPNEYDLCVMNPPYEGDQDAQFIEHALSCSTAVVGLFRSAFVHGSGRWNRLWRHTDIRRLAWLSGRPDFGGDQSAKTDFVAMHLVRRSTARGKGEALTCNVEWW